VSKAADFQAVPFRSKDGGWEVFLRLPSPAGGPAARRHLRARTKAELAAKAAELQSAHADGQVTSGPGMTVLQWLDRWIEEQSDQVRPSTVAGYRTDRRYIAEHIGGIRLPALTSEQVERMYRAVRGQTSVGTAQHLHRTLNAALRRARKRGQLARNPAEDARVPKAGLGELPPKRDLSVEEIARLVPVIAERRTRARWLLALILGVRQGEALGLIREDVDLDRAELHIGASLQRLPWRHGCPASRPCGGKRGADCPVRHSGGLKRMLPKTSAGIRTIPLPPQLVGELRAHLARQAAERLAAGPLWRDGGWVFAAPLGGPIDYSADWAEWRSIVEAAGVRHVRVHDLRHTAATRMGAGGASVRTLMDIFGWSTAAMASRYVHGVSEVQRAAVAGLANGVLGQVEVGPAAFEFATLDT
jgi:integrase